MWRQCTKVHSSDGKGCTIEASVRCWNLEISRRISRLWGSPDAAQGKREVWGSFGACFARWDSSVLQHHVARSKHTSLASNITTSKDPSASSTVRVNAVPVIPDPVITMSAHSSRAADEPAFWMGDAQIVSRGIGNWESGRLLYPFGDEETISRRVSIATRRS
ncbi:hypothetical protein ARMSODRAFT_290076 [Armillaria solidipes]|uniref:Uncharacterized protein n=1 Tax=Armillaria solidipes TaxID=1076256 RepID=A0A2H3C3E4_9AGAR|nr:hypothetical protein ARMSODRAFT_290076 [Armillaria solidipes]